MRRRIGQKMHTDDVKVVRARHINLRPGKTTVADQRIRPRAVRHNWVTADDAVGQVLAGVGLAEKKESGSEFLS